MPVKYPQFFHGLLEPWRGVLLYGPPGTGKTMLAKAVATECGTTFFNIGASSIVSKWRGDSEKLVRVLFDLARHHAPSTIFMDELDAVMSARDGGARGGGDHESSRRLKTELLIQLDGLARGDELVFLLAATNLPWELDPAMLRRLEKRVYVHNTSELIVMAEKETGSFYICYRGTTTLKDALRDVTFLAVDPLAHTSKEGDGMNELGLPRAIASCLSPKRLCHRRMHRGFATRSKHGTKHPGGGHCH